MDGMGIREITFFFPEAVCFVGKRRETQLAGNKSCAEDVVGRWERRRRRLRQEFGGFFRESGGGWFGSRLLGCNAPIKTLSYIPWFHVFFPLQESMTCIEEGNGMMMWFRYDIVALWYQIRIYVSLERWWCNVDISRFRFSSFLDQLWINLIANTQTFLTFLATELFSCEMYSMDTVSPSIPTLFNNVQYIYIYVGCGPLTVTVVNEGS